MEELEKLVLKCEKCKLKECINCEINWTQVQAIENLIAGYKELEADLYEANNIISDQIELLRDSIDKTKVREIFERNIKKETYFRATGYSFSFKGCQALAREIWKLLQ